MLREKNSNIIPGNHDIHAGQMIPKNPAVFDFPDIWYDLDYRQRSELGKYEIWLHEEDDLNPLYTIEDFEFMEKHDCRISFTGHTHIRGFNAVSRGHFKQYRYKNLILKAFPICIGIHPVINHNNRNGFCKFDIERSMLQAIRS